MPSSLLNLHLERLTVSTGPSSRRSVSATLFLSIALLRNLALFARFHCTSAPIACQGFREIRSWLFAFADQPLSLAQPVRLRALSARFLLTQRSRILLPCFPLVKGISGQFSLSLSRCCQTIYYQTTRQDFTTAPSFCQGMKNIAWNFSCIPSVISIIHQLRASFPLFCR